MEAAFVCTRYVISLNFQELLPGRIGIDLLVAKTHIFLLMAPQEESPQEMGHGLS